MARLPPTFHGQQFTIPRCRTCRSSENVVRHQDHHWICTACLEIKKTPSKTPQIHFPRGVEDPHKVVYRDLFPNRRARRRSRVVRRSN